MTPGGIALGGLALGGLSGGLVGGETAADVLDRSSSSCSRRAEESTSASQALLSLVERFESKCAASSLRPTPVCETMSRDHTIPTASTALKSPAGKCPSARRNGLPDPY